MVHCNGCCCFEVDNVDDEEDEDVVSLVDDNGTGGGGGLVSACNFVLRTSKGYSTEAEMAPPKDAEITSDAMRSSLILLQILCSLLLSRISNQFKSEFRMK